jgi:hypothetical protein
MLRRIALDYFVPTILHRGGRIFVPEGGLGRDALCQPSDLALVPF